MSEADARWSEIEPLLDRLFDLPVEDREALLDELAASDWELSHRVRAILEAGESDQAIPASPELLLPDLVLEAASGSGAQSGERCGPFRLLEKIGEGGMGEVFLAERADGLFRQRVAVKLLHRLSPRVRERFERERQILADLRHEHIARLLDGGMTDGGRPFIALEYVAGEPLVTFCDAQRLGQEERLRLFLQACAAVEHAHRLGIVHRDLKPSNLVVGEEPERGAWLYVLDFGIARLASDSDLTRSGEIVGTPGYMSPEQIRGELEAIDRRSDVFSLGVVLYELLCGQRPFRGESAASVLAAVLAGDAPAPRSLVVDLSRDLATIVQTCLETDRARRYDSVKALAGDVERYLAGEPIAARPAGPGRRWIRSARRHPLAAATLAVLLAAGTVAGLGALRTRRILRERTEVASRIGREVEQVSSFLRFAHLSELHDTATEQQRLERRMSDLAESLEGLDPSVEAAARSAIGQGYLGLGAPRRALVELERAWDLGFESPETAVALVEAHAQLYLRDRRAAERVGDEALRARRLAEADRRHRQPAERFAERVGGALLTASAPLASALVASVEGRYEESARQATAAAHESPWLYEGHLLAGDAWSAAAEAELVADHPSAALELYTRARKSYRQAAEIGRSDPAPALRQVDLEQRVGELLFFATGGDAAEAIAAGLAAARRAAAASSISSAPYEGLAALQTLAGREQDKHGQDPSASFRAAIQSARRAVEVAPRSAEAYWRLGDAWDFLVGFERESGADPSASLAQAVAALERAAELAPQEPGIVNSLGLTLWERFHLLEDGDPAAAETADREIAAFSRAVELADDFARGWSNLGTAQNHRAQAAKATGEDPLPFFERAVASFERAVEVDPSFAFAYNNLGNVFLNRGIYLRGKGEDAQPDFARAVAQFELAATRNPTWAFPQFNLANVEKERASALAAAGEDASEAIRAGVAACRRGFELRPGFEPAQALCTELRALAR